MRGAHSHSGCSVGAGSYVRSSFSQWVFSRSWELCEELILTVGVTETWNSESFDLERRAPAIKVSLYYPPDTT